MSKTARSKGDRAFDVAVYVLLASLLLIVLYPLYFVVIASFSGPAQVTSGKVILYPKAITFEAYMQVIKYKPLWIGYRNTIIYVLSKTALSTFLTLMAGFALSRRFFIGRGLVMKLMTITMFFSGGLVPTYLWVTSIGLKNSPLVIILLGCIGVYDVIVTRTFMSSTIPDELWEAASIDGSDTLCFFFRIVLPLSPAIIAVIVLWNAVGEWNSWFTALIYLTDDRYMPLQIVLRRLLASTQNMMNDTEMITTVMDNYTVVENLAELMRYALIVVSTLPIMCLYPFLQKYFIKGVMVGSLKG